MIITLIMLSELENAPFNIICIENKLSLLHVTTNINYRINYSINHATTFSRHQVTIQNCLN